MDFENAFVAEFAEFSELFSAKPSIGLEWVDFVSSVIFLVLDLRVKPIKAGCIAKCEGSAYSLAKCNSHFSESVCGQGLLRWHDSSRKKRIIAEAGLNPGKRPDFITLVNERI